MKIPTVINGRLIYSDQKSTRKKERERSPTETRASHKVKILGDSHFRGIASKIDQYLTTKFEIDSWIKPEANTQETVNTLENDSQCLRTQDVIVVSGGKHMAQFIQENTHSNIIIVNIPPRHDVERNSIINLEIQATNMKLNKIANVYNTVMIVDTNLHRKCFTRHGLHLNKYGKEWLAKQIATHIYTLVENNTKSTPIIPLKWKIETISKQDSVNPMTEQTVICPINSNETNGPVTEEQSTNRVLNRNRRLPITRSKDFLW